VAGGLEPIAAAALLGHRVRHAMRDGEVDEARVRWAVDEVRERALATDVLSLLVPLALKRPMSSFEELLERAGYRPASEEDVKAEIRREVKRTNVRRPEARHRAIMGRVRATAWGNVPLAEVAAWVEEATR
jgi:Glu-tRNA(Gln) amidotransferase subunit E-like FAD-binding protein